MAAPVIPSAELEAMCATARRVANICGTLGLGDPRASELEPLFRGYHAHHEHVEHDPDVDPFIWED